MGLRINGAGGFVLGVNVLATNVSVVLADICGHVIDRVDLNPRRIEDPNKTLDELKVAKTELIERNNVPLNRLFGVGFAIAGFSIRAPAS